MNYKLAKRLKDAGYPQPWGMKYLKSPSGEILPYKPTLEELIEACGEEYRNLVLHTQYRKKLDKPYEAVPNKKLRPECKSQKGKTPTEAVTLLWLELNNHAL